DGGLHDLERSAARGSQLVADHLPVFGLPRRILLVGGRRQAGERGVVATEERPQLPGEAPEEIALGGRKPKLEVSPAGSPHPRLERPHESCCMVAHRPWACSRYVSNSAFSRGPLETTALPL